MLVCRDEKFNKYNCILNNYKFIIAFVIIYIIFIIILYCFMFFILLY